jgi:hypothetical protein
MNPKFDESTANCLSPDSGQQLQCGVRVGKSGSSQHTVSFSIEALGTQAHVSIAVARYQIYKDDGSFEVVSCYDSLFWFYGSECV